MAQKVVRITHQDLVDLVEKDRKDYGSSADNTERNNTKADKYDKGSKKSKRPALQIYQPGMLRQNRHVKQDEGDTGTNSKEGSPALENRSVSEVAEELEQTHLVTRRSMSPIAVDGDSTQVHSKPSHDEAVTTDNIQGDVGSNQSSDDIVRIRVSQRCPPESEPSSTVDEGYGKQSVESDLNRRKKRPDIRVYVPRVKAQHEKVEVADSLPSGGKDVCSDAISTMTVTVVNDKVKASDSSQRKVDISGSPGVRTSKKYTSSRRHSSNSFSDHQSEVEDSLSSSKDWDSEVEREVMRMKRESYSEDVGEPLTESQNEREIKQLRDDLAKKSQKKKSQQPKSEGCNNYDDDDKRRERSNKNRNVDSKDSKRNKNRQEISNQNDPQNNKTSDRNSLDQKKDRNSQRRVEHFGEESQRGTSSPKPRKHGKNIRHNDSDFSVNSDTIEDNLRSAATSDAQPMRHEKYDRHNSGSDLSRKTNDTTIHSSSNRRRNNSGSSRSEPTKNHNSQRDTASPSLVFESRSLRNDAANMRDTGSPSRGARGGGLIRLPMNSGVTSQNVVTQHVPRSDDFPSLPQRQPQATGRGRGRGRGRGNMNRTLYDPSNPSAQFASNKGSGDDLEFYDPYDTQESPEAISNQAYSEDCNFSDYGQGQYYYNYAPPPAAPGPYFNYPVPVDYYGMPYQMPPVMDNYYRGSSRQENQAAIEQVLGELEPLRNQLTNILSRRLKTGREHFERINRLRKEVGHRYKQLVLLNPELTNANGGSMEQTMWRIVFYQLIESLRKHMADDSDPVLKEELLSLLEEGSVFYEDLLDRLEDTFKFKLEDFLDQESLPPMNISRLVKLAVLTAHRSMIALGDIARYKEQAADTTNYGRARNWYLKAQHLAPKNGRPYNQLAILALYTRRKLDAVYFYMRSLASSNAFETAKESLVSLFEEVHKKAFQAKKKVEDEKAQSTKDHNRRQLQHQERRIEIWISLDGSKEADEVDDNKDPDLLKLSSSELNKRFVLSFLQVHGKLFTKIGMETFPETCSLMLREFHALLQQSPEPISSTRLLQLMAVNMFTVSNTELKDKSQAENCRSLLQENALQVSFDMIGLLAQRSRQLLDIHIKSDAYPSMLLGDELHLLLPSIKLWSDWMTCHHTLWNPVPSSIEPELGPIIETWRWIADLLNAISHVDISHVSLHDQAVEGCLPVILPEDGMMAGYVPLLNLARRLTYVHSTVDREVAKDCLRISRLRTFGDYLCGVEPPVLLYDVQSRKYTTIVTSGEEESQPDNTCLEEQHSDSEGSDDVVVESETEEDVEHVRELRAKKEELKLKMIQQEQIVHSRQAVFDSESSVIELEIRPLFLIPDTNCFIDHLKIIKALVQSLSFTVVVPLVVINELDGLSKGGRQGQFESPQHVKLVQRCAIEAVSYLEDEFDERNSRLKALTSKGSVMDTISYRSEESDHIGNNDDLILSCCLHYCKDKARDFMPKDKGAPIKLVREVVLLTDDRNLRLKAHTRNVPVKDLPSFSKWAKVR